MKQKLKLSPRQKKFWELPVSLKRVAVARDVIAQLNAKKIYAQRGTYFDISSTGSVLAEEKLDTTLMNLLNLGDTRCSVCGIGAIFIGMVSCGDNISTNDATGGWTKAGESISDLSVGDSTMRGHLNKIFSQSQLQMIECAFERKENFIAYGAEKGKSASYDERCKAADFGWAIDNDEDRLRAIMKNIIKNKGTFKP